MTQMMRPFRLGIGFTSPDGTTSDRNTILPFPDPNAQYALNQWNWKSPGAEPLVVADPNVPLVTQAQDGTPTTVIVTPSSGPIPPPSTPIAAPATNWFTDSMFGGIPNWMLALGFGLLLWKGGKR